MLSVLLILLVAWGVYHFLGEPDARTRTRAPLPEPAAEPSDGPSRPVARYATLVVHLVGPDQRPIEDGEVGTDIGGAVHWVPAGLRGTRTYTDMEPGVVRIMGRAEGRVQAEQRRRVTAGVRTEVRLVLRPG